MSKPKDFNDEEMQGAFIKMQKLSIMLHTWRSCINCVHFYDSGETDAPNFCSLANQNIPAKVFTVGCPKWTSENALPF